jgi:anhydro-N-acetylmuramic acid kinase
MAAPKSMLVAGVMSGTSADGVDVALCRISTAQKPGAPLIAHALGAMGGKAQKPGAPSASRSHRDSGGKTNAEPRLSLLGHRHFPYPRALREKVLAAMDAQNTSTPELARLHWRLGAMYADCIASTCEDLNRKPNLIACHGQTVYHQAAALPYAGAKVRATWQLGEASVIAEKLRVPVISDFRPADLAAGGQGAPLVPMLDYALFRHATRSRVLINLGGIANVSALPAGGDITSVLAFDTGPANMVIDACMAALYNKPFDRNGAIARRGKVLPQIVEQFAAAPYFAAPPPKSCGREEFGTAFAQRFIAACRRTRSTSAIADADIIATATAFTAHTLREAYARFCWPHLSQRAPLARATELIAGGGGARNAILMAMLDAHFAPLGVKLRTMDALGLPAEAKEAAAFALLGWLTWHGLPGNVPSATGASRPVVLGKVTHG